MRAGEITAMIDNMWPDVLCGLAAA